MITYRKCSRIGRWKIVYALNCYNFIERSRTTIQLASFKSAKPPPLWHSSTSVFHRETFSAFCSRRLSKFGCLWERGKIFLATKSITISNIELPLNTCRTIFSRHFMKLWASGSNVRISWISLDKMAKRKKKEKKIVQQVSRDWR